MTTRPPIAEAIARPIANVAAGGGLPWEALGGGKPPAPVNTVAPVASGTVYIGNSLSTTDGTWTGASSFAYQWQRDGVDVVGATENTFPTADGADHGPQIRCVVTATGAGGSTSANSNALVFVVANLPSLRCDLDPALGVTEGILDDVISWEDQSGVGNVFTDGGVATRRPLRIDSIAGINNKPGIQFDGLTDYLTDTSFSWGAAPNDCTIALVHRQDSLTNGDCILTYGAGNRPAFTQLTGNLVRWFGAGAPSSDTTTAQGGGVFTTVWGRMDGTADTQYVGTANNNEDQDANTNAGAADGGTMALAATTTGGLLANFTAGRIVILRSADNNARIALAYFFNYTYGVAL